jgi:aspartyl-tRNA(Asn)/glutamyl-tRNA(Gln) amidotransferase subunit A
VREDFNRVFRVRDVLASSSSSFSPNTSTDADPEGVDVLLHPSAIRTAPPLELDPDAISGDALQSYVQDVLTVPASLAGLPALTVPLRNHLTGKGEGEGGEWPVGVSVVGQWGCDEMVLRVGEFLEEINN